MTKNKKAIAAPENGILDWIDREVKISELKPFENNPRRISKEDYEKLKKSLAQDGYHQRILATEDLRIVGGHQRMQALRELGRKTVKVLVPPYKMTDEEFRRVLIRDNLPFGEFDYDILANNFEREELIEYGMPEEWLPGAVVEEEEEESSAPAEKKKVTCPECKHEFIPE